MALRRAAGPGDDRRAVCGLRRILIALTPWAAWWISIAAA
jgi:hypothetical protein